MPRNVLWAKMKRTEFAAAQQAGAVIVVPVGSIEQHGEHLPLDTDSDTGFELARRAALAATDFPVLVLPPVWTGYSPHHMSFPGSITLKFKTLLDVLSQVAESIAHHGFRNILFLNGHGGNTPIVSGLRTKLAAESDVNVHGINYWDLPDAAEAMKSICPVDHGFIGHAGEVETSLQMYLQPEQVDPDRARWVPGTSGNPRPASATNGERLVLALVDALLAFLRTIHDGSLERSLEWREDVPGD